MTHDRTSKVVEDLRHQIAGLEGTARKAECLPFGIDEIDARLPGGGLAFGALHEFAGGGSGIVDGAAAALMAAGIAARTQGKNPLVSFASRADRWSAKVDDMNHEFCKVDHPANIDVDIAC